MHFFYLSNIRTCFSTQSFPGERSFLVGCQSHPHLIGATSHRHYVIKRKSQYAVKCHWFPQLLQNFAQGGFQHAESIFAISIALWPLQAYKLIALWPLFTRFHCWGFMYILYVYLSDCNFILRYGLSTYRLLMKCVACLQLKVITWDSGKWRYLVVSSNF